MNVLLFSMPDVIPLFPPRAWRPPNLAIASLAGNVTDHDVTCADLMAKREDVPGAIREAMAFAKPRLVGLSSMTFQFDTAMKVAAFVKKLDPTVQIVLGGYHATLMSEEIAADERSSALLDFMIRGEGETPFNALVHAVAGQGRLEDVTGLSWKKDGRWVHNPRGGLEDLSKLKLPKRSARMWKGECFLRGMQRSNPRQPFVSPTRKQPLDILETSRGCTMPCTFCSMRHMYGRTFRPYPIERVIADIADSKSHGTRWIILSDDNITLDVDRFGRLCDAIVKAGLNNIGYILQASSAGIASSEELVRKMRRANFVASFLGIENVSKRNLAQMSKGDIVERTRKAIRNLHKHGIIIIGGIISGLPDDDAEDVEANYRFLYDEKVDFYGDQVATPYPKTELREEYLKAGLVTNPDNFKRYDGFWANVRTKHLTSDQLQFLRWKFLRYYGAKAGNTPTLRSSFSGLALARALLYRPVRSLLRRVRNWNKTEMDIYREEMKRNEKVNDFFGENDV